MFICGGEVGQSHKRVFVIVSPRGSEHPYIALTQTEGVRILQECRTRGHLYQVSEDFTKATLVKTGDNGSVGSPHEVELTEGQINYIKRGLPQ